MANCIDNFTHGLAVGGSFLLSMRVGALTTFAILIHEVPHEVGDFAILLRAGFSRWDAAKAQLFTASSGLIGSLAAIAFSGLDDIGKILKFEISITLHFEIKIKMSVQIRLCNYVNFSLSGLCQKLLTI